MMKILSKPSWLPFAISFTWLMIVSIAYVYTHKAFSAEMLLAVIQMGWQTFLAVFVLSLAAGLGMRFFKSMDIVFLPLYLAIGMGVFSLGILIVGVFIGVQLWLFLAASVVLLAWLWRDIRQFWQLTFLEWQVIQPVQPFAKLFAFLFVLITLLNLSVALAPPLAFDALVYHLTLPLRYIQAGHITYVADSMFWGMPQLTEMLYLFMLLLGGESAPAVFGCFLGVITLLAMGQYLAQKFGSLTGWFAMLALLSGFSISRLLGMAYIEWFLIFYGLAWLITLEKAIKEKADYKWMVVLGAISGFALSIKYTAGVLSLLAALVLFVQKQEWQSKIRNLIVFGLMVLLVSLPWWIKNLAWTGNPFYPLLFAAANMDEIRLRAFNSIPSQLSLADMLTFPWYITVWGADGKVGPSASIGPILLAFAPLAYWGWREKTTEQRESIRLWTLVLLVGFFIWCVVGWRNGLLQQTRLFVVLFPVWAFLASAGFQSLAAIKIASIRLERIALTILLMFVSFSLFETISGTLPKRAIEANFGLLNREDYLARNQSGLHSASKAIQELEPGSKVVMLWETRSFYCAPVCDPDEIIDRWYHETRLHASAKDIHANWLAQGYTHMLIWDLGFEYVYEYDNAKFNERDWLILDELRQMLGPGQEIEAYTLYPLK